MVMLLMWLVMFLPMKLDADADDFDVVDDVDGA